MYVTIASEVDFDTTIDQIVDESELLGWSCYGVGEPGQLFLHITGEAQLVTVEGKNKFCAWVKTLAGVTSYDVTSTVKSA